MPEEPMSFEESARSAMPTSSALASISISAPTHAAGVQRFIDGHRIHIDRSSYITPNLAIHVGELNPRHEAALRTKLKKAFTCEAPNMYGDEKRAKVMQKLGELIPFSLEAERDIHSRRGLDLMNFESSGENIHAAHLSSRMSAPFSSLVIQWKQTPPNHRYEREKHSNALAMYLMVEMAATKPESPRTAAMQRSFQEIFRYDERSEAALANVMGITDTIPADVVKAALTPPEQGGGLRGAGKAMGLSDSEVEEIIRITDYAADHHFSENVIENWKAGRSPELAGRDIESSIKAGLQKRIDGLIEQERTRVGHRYDVSRTVKAQEAEFAQGIALLPQVLQDTLYEVGAEFIRSPEASLERITGRKGLLGQHRTMRSNPDDYGRHVILVSEARASKEGFLRTLVHECFHSFYPKHITAQDAQKVDQLYNEDAARLNGLKQVMEQCFRGDLSEADTIKILNTKFSVGRLSLETALGPKPDLAKLYYQVQDAHANLHTDSMNYARGGYPSPESKTNEIMSRYAEQRYVTMRDNMALVAWLNPGVTEAHDSVYIPHLEEALEGMKALKREQRAPEHKLMDHLNFAYQTPANKHDNAAQHHTTEAAAKLDIKCAAHHGASPTNIAAQIGHEGMMHEGRAASVAL